mmetsp:Transcript_21824/g.55716  ORF Transcript_21824/g.55716 Transcript_21824/m.55716 type:complete len:337 (-) Transcript_21824:106-1116(-)
MGVLALSSSVRHWQKCGDGDRQNARGMRRASHPCRSWAATLGAQQGKNRLARTPPFPSISTSCGARLTECTQAIVPSIAPPVLRRESDLVPSKSAPRSVTPSPAGSCGLGLLADTVLDLAVAAHRRCLRGFALEGWLLGCCTRSHRQLCGWRGIGHRVRRRRRMAEHRRLRRCAEAEAGARRRGAPQVAWAAAHCCGLRACRRGSVERRRLVLGRRLRLQLRLLLRVQRVCRMQAPLRRARIRAPTSLEVACAHEQPQRVQRGVARVRAGARRLPLQSRHDLRQHRLGAQRTPSPDAAKDGDGNRTERVVVEAARPTRASRAALFVGEVCCSVGQR